MKEVRDALAGIADTVGRNKAGELIVRRGFFYSNGMTSEKFSQHVQAALKAAGSSYLVLDHGKKVAAFRGGQSVAQGSHFWAIVG